MRVMGSYPSTPPPHDPDLVRADPELEPQILPPGSGYTVRSRPAWKKAWWATSPATYLLVGINCAVYVAMVAHKVSPTSPNIGQLMFWGADNAGAVLIGGEWWRIVTAMFVHVGFLHLALNMWCLWNLALLAEPLMGSMGVFAVYILTGAAGNLLSTLVNWLTPLREANGAISFPVGAGASGAVFGIAGALIVLLKSQRLPVPPFELKRLRRSVIYFAAINLVLGFGISAGASFTQSGMRIDNMAHLGGVCCGLLFAAPMVPRLGSPREMFQSRLRVAITMTVGVLVLFGFFIAKLAG
jgi:membrane associated rhomboid family serine protease